MLFMGMSLIVTDLDAASFHAYPTIRKYIVIQMKGTVMKYLPIIVLLVGVMITAGCVNQNTNVVVLPPQTTLVPINTVTTTVPSTVTSNAAINSVSGKVTVLFFYGEECPHCHNVMPFIQNLSKKYPDADFRILETWHNETNQGLYQVMNKQSGIQSAGVPEVIVIGNTTPLVGDRAIPAELEGVILEQLKKRSN
jgi:thiol-disulfide isomerase/thioredoxin